MKTKRVFYIVLIICHFLMVITVISQEIEEYSEEFQESFFEALKQKGIENYDKAINSLLECKRIDTNNTAIDHELAKVYFAIKEYVLAQEYAIATVNSNPENIWYLHTLLKILQWQGNTIITLQHTIPYKNIKLRENLELIKANAINTKANAIKEKQAISTLETLKTKIEALIVKNNFIEVGKISTEALESFPMQPYFYYTKGLSYNENAKYKKAIQILESGLGYILDEDLLNEKIFRELAIAYIALGNTSKAEMYFSKIKK